MRIGVRFWTSSLFLSSNRSLEALYILFLVPIMGVSSSLSFVPAGGRLFSFNGGGLRTTCTSSSFLVSRVWIRQQRNRSARLCVITAAAADAGTSRDDVEELLQATESSERIRGLNKARKHYEDINVFARVLIPIAESDRNPQVRYMAVSQMAALNRDVLTEESKTNLLRAALNILKNDDDTSCQSGAADTVAALRLTDGFDTLVDTFKTTKDWMLRFTIAASMGEFGHPGAYDFLKFVLEGVEPEGDELLIAAVIGAFGELKNADALPVIEQYLDHPDSSIKERAKIAQSMLSSA